MPSTAAAMPSGRLRSTRNSVTFLRIRPVGVSDGTSIDSANPLACWVNSIESERARTTNHELPTDSMARSLVNWLVQYRACRARNSVRSQNRPSQYRWSATRLGRSIAERFSSIDVLLPESKLVGLTGPSLKTQTSLLMVPDARLSSRSFGLAATRATPPASTWVLPRC